MGVVGEDPVVGVRRLSIRASSALHYKSGDGEGKGVNALFLNYRHKN